VREERGENGGETRKKPNGNREERNSRTIVELVSRPIHKRLFFSVLPKISLFFPLFPSKRCAFICVCRCDGESKLMSTPDSAE